MRKKVSMIAVFLFLLGISMNLKSQTMAKGVNLISFGFGPGRIYHDYHGFAPAFKLNYEHGTFKAGPGVITLGATFGYSFHSFTYHRSNVSYIGTWSSFATGVRAAWHCGWGIKGLDTYAGGAGGFRFESYIRKHDGDPKPDFHPFHPYFGGYVGAAYNFHKNVGVFFEGGFDFSYATIGLNFLF